MYQRPSSIHSKDSAHPLIPANTLTLLHIPKQTMHGANIQVTPHKRFPEERRYE